MDRFLYDRDLCHERVKDFSWKEFKKKQKYPLMSDPKKEYSALEQRCTKSGSENS